MGILDAITEAVNAAINFGLWVFDQVFKGVKGTGNFLAQNFPYDKPQSVGFLFVIYFGLFMVFISLFLAGGMVIGVSSSWLGSGESHVIDSGEGGFLSNGSGEGGGGGGGGGAGGDTLTSTTVPGVYDALCGDGICEKSYKTGAQYLSDVSWLTQCDPQNVYYNLPSFCVKSALTTFTDFYGDVVLKAAVCEYGVSDVLNGFCLVENNSLYYVENSGNCPSDCVKDDTKNCIKDFSCLDDPGKCAAYGMVCCPAGSVFNSGACGYKEFGNDIDKDCNGFNTWPGKSLIDIKNTPYRCSCGSDADCVNDFNGHKCCGSGTLHAGYCYSVSYCNLA